MIFQEIPSVSLPCELKIANTFGIPTIKNLDTTLMISRKESNGTLTLLDKKTKQVYFKRNDENIFPLDLPIQIDFELTQKCNLECKHCFVDGNTSFSENTFNIIKKLCKEGVLVFELIGGEPLMVKEIFSIINYLKKQNKIVSICTNGTLITKDIAKRLSENPPDKIFVSLDGSKEINDKIRGKGSFNKTLSGIKNLNEFGITPSISFCINKLNINSIEKLVFEIKRLKIKSLFFIFGEPTKKKSSFNNNFFKHSDRELVASRIKQMKIPLKYIMHFEPKDKSALYFGCFFKLTMCEITPNGDVLSCPIIRKKEGNILEEDLRIIWKRMQNQLMKKKDKKCNICPLVGRCFPCEFD